MRVADVSLCVMPWGVAPATPAELIALASHAETLGFHALTIAHRPVLPSPDEPPAGGFVFGRVPLEYRHYQHDPLVLAPMLIQATKTIGIGFNVLITPWLHPFVWAKYLASLDSASNGRVIAGFGIGYAPNKKGVPALRALGIDSRHRGQMADEALELMTRLWTEAEPISFEGRHFRGNDLVVAPKPVQVPYPELWWAGEADISAGRAARYGRYLELSRPSARSVLEHWMPLLQLENARWGGRAGLAVLLNASVGNTDPAPEELSERYFGWPPHIVERLPVGTPERCAKVLRAYETAGASHFVLDLHRHGLDSVPSIHGQLDLIAERVIPLCG